MRKPEDANTDRLKSKYYEKEKTKISNTINATKRIMLTDLCP
jgi:hypothetical protein